MQAASRSFAAVSEREIPVIGEAAVLAAVPPLEAIARTRGAFERHSRGEWTMPPKVYLDSPPGDFRAMPARGDGLALVKWVTSFPHNPERGRPVVTGVIVVSDSDTGAELAVVDCRSVTWLRTGAAAAVSAQALARPGASEIGLIGCGVNGAWAARCLVAAGYGPGLCHDADRATAEALAAELGWKAGTREEAVAADIVVTCTPGDRPVVFKSDMEPGRHLAVLGADSHGKREVETEAIRHCRLFCDEWEQASAGGELSASVAAGGVRRLDVTEIGDVLTGRAEGRRDEREVTLFDSTGLAIQDLGIVSAVMDAWRAGRVEAPTVPL
jgi:ornithine cyclodeaminase/alanine dehydrogenase-like protein (mu-crystallin family)